MDASCYNLKRQYKLERYSREAALTASHFSDVQRCPKWRISMDDTATLSRLLVNIQPDLDHVDATFQERATSGLDILNSASMHALGSPSHPLTTPPTLLSRTFTTYPLDN